MNAAYAALAARIRDEGIEFVDLRAVDLAGRFRHVTLPAARLTEDLVTQGVGFDGSNYGYRAVTSSDMVLVPDLSTAYVERRESERVLALIGDTRLSGEDSTVPRHQPGSLLSPFIALAAVSRGQSPASLVWDIPTSSDASGVEDALAYHGAVNLRGALANDYLSPLVRLVSRNLTSTGIVIFA